MPKKQSTASRKARLRQAGTGEKYTTALRAQTPEPSRHEPFSASGAGWEPIIERAERRLIEVWPECPRPHWEEKLGDLCWKTIPRDAPKGVWRVVNAAAREASNRCQTCSTAGRKRVVWVWDRSYGWVMPWVKTCCDACCHVPEQLRNRAEYLDLVEQYEESPSDADGCCVAIEGLALVVRAQFERGGVPALLAKLEELGQSLYGRSPHHDVYSGHAVVLAADEACVPLVHRVWQRGVVTEPALSAAERQQVLQPIAGLEKALSAMTGEEHRG